MEYPDEKSYAPEKITSQEFTMRCIENHLELKGKKITLCDLPSENFYLPKFLKSKGAKINCCYFK